MKQKIIKWLKDLKYKYFPYKIYIIKDWSRGNDYTKYRILHEKFHFNKPNILNEVIEIYGQNCENIVYYSKAGKTKEGYTIWKIKHKNEEKNNNV